MARKRRAKRSATQPPTRATQPEPPEPPEPLVEGESARLILDTLRSFPLSLGPRGEIVLDDTATGEARAALDRAYERSEMVLMNKEAHCSHAAAHRTLDPDEFRALVLDELAWAAKTALGETAHLDPLWMPWRPGPRGPRPLASPV